MQQAAERAVDSVKDVAEGAAEFVETMTDTKGNGGKDESEQGPGSDPEQSNSNDAEHTMSLEERRKKLNELRARMVRPFRSILTGSIHVDNMTLSYDLLTIEGRHPSKSNRSNKRVH